MSAWRRTLGVGQAHFVVAENEVLAVPGLELAERPGDPGEAAGLLQDVAGDADQVGREAFVSRRPARRTLGQVAGHVQVGQVSNGQAVELARQSRQPQRLALDGSLQIWLPGMLASSRASAAVDRPGSRAARPRR